MKKLLAIFLCLSMVLLAACSAAPTQTQPATGDALKSFTVTVVYADGSQKDFTYKTAQTYVGPVLQEEGLIQGNVGAYGLEITHVDGVQAIYDTDKAYWALYEGEEYAMQGIDTTPVVDGGTYKLVYTPA